MSGLAVALQLDLFVGLLFVPALLAIPLLALFKVQSYFNSLIILLLGSFPLASLVGACAAELVNGQLLG